MATVDVEKLVIQIEARTRNYENALKKMERNTGRSTRRMAKQYKSLGRQVKLAGKAFAAAFAIRTVGQIPGLLRDIVSEASNIGKIADKIGFTTTALQELRFAAELTGTGMRALDVGLQRFSRRIAEAANKTGVLYPILKANNVQLRNSDGSLKSNSRLLAIYADLIKNAGSEQERLLLTFKAFDTEGASLINLLKNGSAGLKKMSGEAAKAGGVIDESLIRRMEEIDDKFAKISRTISGKFKASVVDGISLLDTLMSDTSGMAKVRAMMAFAGPTVKPEKPKNIQDQQVVKRSTKSDMLSVKPRTIIPPGGGGGNGGGSRRAKASDEAARQNERIKGVVEALRFEAEQLGRTETMQRVYNELKTAGISLDSEQGQQIQLLVEKLAEAEKQTEAMAVAQEHLNEAKEFFGDLAVEGLTDMIVEGAKAKDVINNLTKALARAALQGLLLGKGPLGGLLGGGGGILGSLMGGLLGAKAIGGPVAGGKSYVVGERGPEVFTPQGSGNITPNSRINSNSGGATIVMHNDFRGADAGAVGAISAQLNRLQRDLPNMIKGTVSNERRLNPGAA